jgi:hypothetical protein
MVVLLVNRDVQVVAVRHDRRTPPGAGGGQQQTVRRDERSRPRQDRARGPRERRAAGAAHAVDDVLARVAAAEQQRGEGQERREIQHAQLEPGDHLTCTLSCLLYSSKSLTRTMTVTCQVPGTPSVRSGTT